MRKEKNASYAFIESIYPNETSVQHLARQKSEEIGLSGISISQTEALMISWICRLIKPEKIVEIGTLTGLSGSYFLDILPQNGKLWSFEKSELHLKLATEVLSKEINEKRCQIILGDALQKLPEINSEGPFDIIFIDGNKAAYYDYWIWAKKNLSQNGVIFIDNVFLAGSVWGDSSQQKFNDKQINNVKKMISEIVADHNFNSMIIPTQEGLLCAKFN